MGIPQSGFATIANSSTPLRIILANGVSLPSAVMNAIKYTMIQTAMKIPTAHNPRLQFALRSSRSLRTHLSVPYCVSLVFLEFWSHLMRFQELSMLSDEERLDQAKDHRKLHGRWRDAPATINSSHYKKWLWLISLIWRVHEIFPGSFWQKIRRKKAGFFKTGVCYLFLNVALAVDMVGVRKKSIDATI